MKKTNLIIFTKPFNSEKAKTRLRKSGKFTNEQVNKIHNNLLSYTLNTCKEIKNTHLEIHWAEDLKQDSAASEYKNYFEFKTQKGLSFTERFINAITNDYNTIIIGSDCPMISPEIINTAIRSLESNDCVIGPSRGQGFYLLGLVNSAKKIDFDSIFSKDNQQVSKIRSNFSESNCTLLPELVDVDEYKDIEYLKSINFNKKIFNEIFK